MCGICGAVASEMRCARRRSSPHACWISSRGPDDEGLLVSRRQSWYARLSIIDLRAATSRSTNETGDVGVVFNGRNLQFSAVAAELEPRHRFLTRSDTEVIVHALRRVGRALC